MRRSSRVLRPRGWRCPLGGLAIFFAAATLAPAAHAGGPDAATRSAEALANQAYDEHAAGKYPEAIASYLKAYEVSKSGVILFNVATIYDKKLHERELAADYFRRYLRAPDAEPQLVQRANERLATLKQETESEERRRAAIAATPVPIVAPPPGPVVPPRSEATVAPDADHASGDGSRPLRAVAVGVGAVGVAGLGASLVLGALAKGKNEDANALCNGTECSSERGVTLAHQAGGLATASTVAFISGVTLVLGGVTMYVVAPKRATSTVTVVPDVAFSRAGMLVRGTF